MCCSRLANPRPHSMHTPTELSTFCATPSWQLCVCLHPFAPGFTRRFPSVFLVFPLAPRSKKYRSHTGSNTVRYHFGVSHTLYALLPRNPPPPPIRSFPCPLHTRDMEGVSAFRLLDLFGAATATGEGSAFSATVLGQRHRHRAVRNGGIFVYFLASFSRPLATHYARGGGHRDVRGRGAIRDLLWSRPPVDHVPGLKFVCKMSPLRHKSLAISLRPTSEIDR